MNLSQAVAELENSLIDFDGRPMTDGEEPRFTPTCGHIRTVLAALSAAHAAEPIAFAREETIRHLTGITATQISRWRALDFQYPLYAGPSIRLVARLDAAEPSLAMQSAGWREVEKQGFRPDDIEVAPIFKAMAAASTFAKSPEGQELAAEVAGMAGRVGVKFVPFVEPAADKGTPERPLRIWTCNETRNIWISEPQEDTTEYVLASSLQPSATVPVAWLCNGKGDGWEERDKIITDPELAEQRQRSPKWTVVALGPVADTPPPREAVQPYNKAQGAIRKLEALKLAFNMKGANATTIERAIDVLRTVTRLALQSEAGK